MATKRKPKAKGTRVSNAEKRKMWELYQNLGTINAVARKCRRDRGTVSRYVAEYEAMLVIANVLEDEKRKAIIQ